MAVTLTFSDIAQAIRNAKLPTCDLVVGIGRGGIVPACLVAYELQQPLHVTWVTYRDDDNRPRYDTPRLMRPSVLPAHVRKILLVDDVSVTGKTLELASATLCGQEVTTLVLKGSADIVLFPHIQSCVDWPWNPTGHRSVLL